MTRARPSRGWKTDEMRNWLDPSAVGPDLNSREEAGRDTHTHLSNTHIYLTHTFFQHTHTFIQHTRFRDGIA